jgi:hypothetical protein
MTKKKMEQLLSIIVTRRLKDVLALAIELSVVL